MKSLIKCSMAVLLAWPATMALAQTKPGPVKGTAQPTPIIHAGGPGNTMAGGLGQNSNIHSVNVRLKQQMRQVRKDLKAGKLTKDQAKAAFAKFKSIRQQELQFFRQNGKKEITSDQKNQLNAALDQNNEK